MDPGGKIYTIDEFRCWKVENLDDERSDEKKNEGGGYQVLSPQKVSRFAPLNLLYDIIYINSMNRTSKRLKMKWYRQCQ
jgi:hypothetical protein